MRSRKTSSSSSKESPVTTAKDTKDDLGPKFDRMIGLMEEQNRIMTQQSQTQTEQSQILRDHSKMLEALEKDATRGLTAIFTETMIADDKVVDDKAYEERGLKDESTWGALDKEALAKIKVLVDGWKDLMNVSLIFVSQRVLGQILS